jgi:hypothetical protein
MSNRTERRAAERAARKAARAVQPAQLPVTGAPLTPTETSQAFVTAHRINALKATGPRPPEGCAKSSLNALKTWTHR